MLMCTNSSFMGCCGNGSHVIGSLGFFAGKNDGSCMTIPRPTSASLGCVVTRRCRGEVIELGKMVSFFINEAAALTRTRITSSATAEVSHH